MALVSAIDLMKELRERGVRLSVVNDSISATPSWRVDDGLFKRLVEHREELKVLIRLVGPDYQVEIDPKPWSAEFPLTSENAEMLDG